MKDNLKRELLQRRMSRKEFLSIIGGSMLMVFGLGRLYTLLQNKPQDLPKLGQQTSNGFGSRKFGA